MAKTYWAAGVAIVVVGVLVAANYRQIVVRAAPAKHAAAARGDAALKADEIFWKAFHAGELAKAPDVLAALTAAYLQTPNDAVTAAHIGFMHMWQLTEGSHRPPVAATITDHATLARKYFAEAVALDPRDARYLGFLASAMLAEGGIHRDEKLLRQGYFKLLDSVDAWPEFNLFTAGYVMSRQPAESKFFRDGLDMQWKNIDVCIGEKVDRQNPDGAKYMHLETTTGGKRVCWNSWIAPHNFEGFLLNMGDMLVKSGDWHTARKIYTNAKLSRTYGDWKYRKELEDRIAQAEVNVARFNAQGPAAKPMMINSEFTCMVCHRE
jgi:hypothetical protein